MGLSIALNSLVKQLRDQEMDSLATIGVMAENQKSNGSAQSCRSVVTQSWCNDEIVWAHISADGFMSAFLDRMRYFRFRLSP